MTPGCAAVKSAMILLNADVREAAAKMFAEPEGVGDAEALDVEALEVELGVVVLPQAAASIVKQATATMERVLLETFIGSPLCRPQAPRAPRA